MIDVSTHPLSIRHRAWTVEREISGYPFKPGGHKDGIDKSSVRRGRKEVAQPWDEKYKKQDAIELTMTDWRRAARLVLVSIEYR